MSIKIKKWIGMLAILFWILYESCCFYQVKAATIEPTDTQKIEFEAVQLKETGGKQQVIIEVWIHQLNFKGFDIRLNYDEILLTPSNVTTNEIVDVNDEPGIPSCFEFTNEFGNYMDMFAMENQTGEFRTIFSLLGADEITGTNTYLKQDEKMENYVEVKDSVLLGRLSFQVGEGEFTANTFSLKGGETSPKTGIKVNVNESDSYEKASLFQFTLSLASDNAYLNNLQTNLSEITDFNKTKFDYEINITKEADKMQIIPTAEDRKSTIKINGEEAISGTPFEVTLNPIGEETDISILVMAEDR